MKKILKKLSVLALGLALLSCGKKSENKLIIGVSPIPHEQIIEFVREDLKKENIDLEVVVFNDYVQPNLALKDKSIDANFFQHVPYMESFGKENNIEMVSAGAVHLEPLRIYSNKIKKLDELNKITDKIDILIPNDPTNRGRALILLETASLLKLKDNKKLDSSISDIETIDPKFNIVELNSEQIAPRLDEVYLAIINTNNALANKITKEQSVFTEGKESPYKNVITVLKGNENSKKIKTLIKILQSEKVKEFIKTTYNEEVVPAF